MGSLSRLSLGKRGPAAVKRKRAISMDKALALLPRLQEEFERLYRSAREQGLTQTQHLENKKALQVRITEANLPGWAKQQLSGYDRALYRQQERDTVFVYRCPDTSTFYTTRGQLCPGLEVYPPEKILEASNWNHGTV